MENDYRKIDIYGNIDEAVRKLQMYNERGEKVYTIFNGVKLFSDSVTLDGAYLSILGKTKKDYEKNQIERQKKLIAEQAATQSNIPMEIRKWIDMGRKVLDNKYWQSWDSHVLVRVSDNNSIELGKALDIIDALNNHCEFIEAKNMLEEQNNISERITISIIRDFCDRGNKFYSYVRGESE